MKKNNKKLNSLRCVLINKRGFTLVEVVVAIGIFVIIMAGSSSAFASAFKSYKGAKNVNENIKNIQYTMNLMSKTFRTSSVKSASGENMTGSEIIVYDYSQNLCIKFRFNGGNLYKASSSTTFGNCNSGAVSGTGAVMVTGITDGRFRWTDSHGDGGGAGTSERVGKITVMMEIRTGIGSNASSARIQSTSSLRDYEVSNVGFDSNNPPT